VIISSISLVVRLWAIFSSPLAQKEGYEIIALHFNYGQRTQAKELECFRKIAKDIDAKESYEIDLGFFEQIGASALTDMSIDIPTGGYSCYLCSF